MSARDKVRASAELTNSTGPVTQGQRRRQPGGA
ncbi:hypothetical protein FOIG_12844 [Fusarium odoratissimum NRRL 54006]|uniref:Uncharacterized protein n=1 Tax=Fusarium odoratissimum (strain NRRL 54006) TaxID=1089451 RepID=X0JD29_FUSO5|nr:uncharacterized protein FOIG_12844 [Fusarium odoratissimum NRRL 54006]EXL94271.1 hypothetical protein FOIG_12844 [Fusarium odoratissimum NRRL 54006]